MKNSKKYAILLVIMLFILNTLPLHAVKADENEWLLLPEMKDVPLDKTFTINFNLPISTKDIDGIVIYQNNTFLPVEIETKNKQAFVKPVHKLSPNSTYEIRAFISNKRYKMQFHTVRVVEPEETMVYKGKTDVRSQFANNELVQNVHHYELSMGEGHVFNIYVTDDYEKQYGKGFAYDETIDIIKSIEKQRKVKPYTMKRAALNIFLYTNESKGPLPSNYQAVIGSWDTNFGEGIYSEMLMNGSTMPYDFRSSYVHEFVHYFDYQSYISQYGNIYRNYWGQDYSFWLLEGGAEYGSYFFYDYPRNDKNQLFKNFVQPTKESIKQYAKNQGSNKQNLLYDLEMNSFDDIYKASSNNYGITLSLFWYLVEQYGYDEIYDYVRYVGENFSANQPITQQQKNETAVKFFGKTEEQVLKDWLKYFDTFDGELMPYSELTTAKVNHVMFEDNTLLNSDVIQWKPQLSDHNAESIYFLLNVKEWIKEGDYSQSNTFRDYATNLFELKAEGYPTVQATATGLILSNGYLTNGDALHSFEFNINATEAKKLAPNVNYTLVPIKNHDVYKWVVPEDVVFKYNP